MVQRAIDEFEFGLARVLDGIGAFIRRSGRERGLLGVEAVGKVEHCEQLGLDEALDRPDPVVGDVEDMDRERPPPVPSGWRR